MTANNPTGGKRWGGSSPNHPPSQDVLLASIEFQLVTHGQLIEQLVAKVDNLSGSVREMQTTMHHLVTKAACAEGRKELSDDLKARMDGDREITGMNITLPKLLQKYANNGKPTPLPSKSRASTYPSGHPRERKTVIYYIKAISAIVSLSFALFTMTFFAFKMISRMDEQQRAMQDQQRVMQTIRQNLEHIDAGRDLAPSMPQSIMAPGPVKIPQDSP